MIRLPPKSSVLRFKIFLHCYFGRQFVFEQYGNRSNSHCISMCVHFDNETLNIHQFDVSITTLQFQHFNDSGHPYLHLLKLILYYNLNSNKSIHNK